MAKYCIYKKSWGDIEAWEYIDDVEEACQYWYIRDVIKKYGAEKVLPIAMNKVGGYHSVFTDEVIAIIESDTWPSLSSHYELFKDLINNEKFNYGWIDSLGNTYTCRYMGHAALAADLVTLFYLEEFKNSELYINGINAPDDFLLEKGWIKVLKGNPAQIYYDEKVSKKALNKLLEIKNHTL
jgi:hypothetical protein